MSHLWKKISKVTRSNEVSKSINKFLINYICCSDRTVVIEIKDNGYHEFLKPVQNRKVSLYIDPAGD